MSNKIIASYDFAQKIILIYAKFLLSMYDENCLLEKNNSFFSIM